MQPTVPVPLSLTAAGAVPQEILLLPAGAIARTINDAGRGGPDWRLDDPAAVLAATRQIGHDLPIDFDHGIDQAKVPGSAARGEAAGWLRLDGLDARPDGIWGRVEWTERARAAIAAGEYRFVSPVFLHDRTGRVTRLVRAGLVNDPAINMAAIAAAQIERDDMSLAETLRGLLKLDAKADDAAIATAVAAAAKPDPDAVEAAAAKVLAPVARALGLAEDAKPEAVAAAAAKAVAAPDPEKFVHADAFTKLARDLADLRGERAAEKAEAAAAAAIEAGKVEPALRDWAVGYAKSDPEAFAAFVKAKPAVLARGSRLAAAPPAGDAPLTQDELAVARAMGLTSEKELEAFRKNRPTSAAEEAA